MSTLLFLHRKSPIAFGCSLSTYRLTVATNTRPISSSLSSLTNMYFQQLRLCSFKITKPTLAAASSNTTIISQQSSSEEEAKRMTPHQNPYLASTIMSTSTDTIRILNATATIRHPTRKPFTLLTLSNTNKQREKMDQRYFRQFSLILRSLHWFLNQYGHLEIPRNFKLPILKDDTTVKDTSMDSDMQGYRLGFAIHNIKHQAFWMRSPYAEYLMDLGIIPESSPLQYFYSAKSIEEALRIYRNHYGHLDIPLGYKIGTNDDSELFSSIAGMEGAPLGQMLVDIKKRSLWYTLEDVAKRWRPLKITFEQEGSKIFFLSVRNSKSNAISGSAVQHIDHSRLTHIVEAITIYKKHYGDIRRIPKKYTINVQEQHLYPRHLHGMNLGSFIKDIMSKANWTKEPCRTNFIELGVIPSADEKLERKYSATEIEKCFQIYKKQHGDLFLIPRDYCISEHDLQHGYPQYLINAPLGEIYYAVKGRRLHFNSHDVMMRWKKLGIQFSSKV